MKKIALRLTATHPTLSLSLAQPGSSTAADIAKITPGPPGEEANAALFFQVSNRFYEIAGNEPAKQTARSNLGLAVIDGGTFN
jgi:hypothetical protein